MYKTRTIMACMAGLSVFFGAILVALGVTGSVTWSGRIPGGAFEVESTHVGIGFALVGMTIYVFMLLKPSKYERTVKTRLSYSPGKVGSARRYWVEIESHTKGSSSPVTHR